MDLYTYTRCARYVQITLSISLAGIFLICTILEVVSPHRLQVLQGTNPHSFPGSGLIRTYNWSVRTVMLPTFINNGQLVHNCELFKNRFAHIDKPSKNLSTMTTFEGGFPAVYNPRQILDHPEFRVLQPSEKPSATANIAAFYNPAHEIHLVEKPRPKPGPGQVLVHVRATGICGSDVHFWKHGAIGPMVVTDEVKIKYFSLSSEWLTPLLVWIGTRIRRRSSWSRWRCDSMESWWVWMT